MLSKNTLALLICVALPLLLIACGDNGTTTPTPPPPEGYYPIQTGSVWQFGLTGTETDETGNWNVTGSETWTVMGVSTHDEGFNVYQMEISWSITHTPVGGGTSYTTSNTYTDYVYVDDNIVRWYDQLSSTSFTVELDLPLAVGNHWDYWPDFPGWASVTVQSLSASVTVPAGSFDGCAHLAFDYGQAPDDYLNRYYAEGTGMISQIQHEDNGTTDIKTYEYKLASYSQ